MIAAAEEERFRRIRHWAGFPSQAIAYCLREAGVEVSDVEHIAFNQDGRANLARKICYFLIKRPNTNLVLRRLRNRHLRAGLPALIVQAFPGKKLRAEFHSVEHHLALGDMGPFSTVEDGWHVRRGYSRLMLEELCDHSGLKVERISYCSGYVSQKVAAIMRRLSVINAVLAWTLVLPLRVLPPLVDSVVTVLSGWPHYSICLEAYKPRKFPEL